MSDKQSSEIFDYRNANGYGWSFYKCDGILRKLVFSKTPEDDMEMLHQVQNLELRNDDVMIVAFPKCGTHWLWEIVTMIQKGRVEYHAEKKEIAMLGLPLYEKADQLPSPRILNSHLFFRHLPKKLVEKKIKTIHILRNPKDVSVSYFHHLHDLKPPIGFEGPYLEFMELFIEGKTSSGGYFEYIHDWQQVQKDHPDLPLLTIFYEDLMKEPVRTIQTVATFLDQPISAELTSEIAEACSFTKLKVADKEVKLDHAKDKESLWKEGHTGIYRKGKIGDWKNWLTVATNEQFDDFIESEMKGTGITFAYE